MAERETELCFNTTFVTVYRINRAESAVTREFQYNLCYCLSSLHNPCIPVRSGFNTTFVTVYHLYASGLHICARVSIQPLLLFIMHIPIQAHRFPMFQYNLCYCLSFCENPFDVLDY